MAWVAKKKRTRWVLNGKTVAARTPGARKKTVKSEYYYAFWYEGKRLVQVELRGCTDRGAAQTRMNGLLREASSSSLSPGGKAPLQPRPLASYRDAYFAQLERTRRPYTVTLGRRYVSLFLGEVGDSCTLGDLTHNLGLHKTAGAEGRLKHLKNVASMINSFLRYVCQQEGVKAPPCGLYSPDKDPSYRVQAHGTLSLEEASLFLSRLRALKPSGRERLRHRRYLVYWLMLTTLTRWKTLHEVTVSQLDLGESPALHLRADQTKSSRAVSKPLTPAVAEELRLHLGSSGLSPGDRPFLMCYTGFYQGFVRDLKACGIRLTDPAGRILAPHSLKATGITLLLDQGLDVATIAELAEHTDVKLTLRVYADSILRKRPLLAEQLLTLEQSLTRPPSE